MSKAKQALYLIISLLVIIADQLLKNYIVTNFKIGDEKTIIPGVLSFTYLQNDGAAWNSIRPSNEYSGLISFRIDWFDFLHK